MHQVYLVRNFRSSGSSYASLALYGYIRLSCKQHGILQLSAVLCAVPNFVRINDSFECPLDQPLVAKDDLGAEESAPTHVRKG